MLFHDALARDPSPGELVNSRRFITAALDADAAAEAATVAETAERVAPAAWRYGYGELDEAAGRLAGFTPLPHFDGEAWGGGEEWPDADLGWVQLTASGGHVGNDLQHAAVRRWISPLDTQIDVRGMIGVTEPGGDGVRATVLSDRRGVLGTWVAEFGSGVAAELDAIEVVAGERIDFVVDCRPAGNIQCDQFTWAPKIHGNDGAGVFEWSAERDFAGAPGGATHRLDAWERFAHTLLLSNAFMFVD